MKKAVEIQTTTPPRDGSCQLCIVEMSFISLVLLMTRTDAKRELGPFSMLFNRQCLCTQQKTSDVAHTVRSY